MGRPRSKYICPKCNEPGYKEHSASRNGNYPNSKYRKYWRVVHYNSITKKKERFCHIDYILWEREPKNWKRWWVDYKNKLETMSPTELQEHVLNMIHRQRQERAILKQDKEILEYLATKYNIHLPKEG